MDIKTGDTYYTLPSNPLLPSEMMLDASLLSSLESVIASVCPVIVVPLKVYSVLIDLPLIVSKPGMLEPSEDSLSLV